MYLFPEGRFMLQKSLFHNPEKAFYNLVKK